MKFVIQLLIAICLPILLQSTCIIVYRVNNTIYIVADTKSVIKSLDATLSRPSKTIQKIHQKGKYFFAISGWSDSTQLTIANKYVDTTRPLRECITNFTIAMKDYYWKLLKSEKEYNPNKYKERLGNDICQVAFFTYSNSGTQLFGLGIFPVEENGELILKYNILENPGMLWLGISDHLMTIPDALMKNYFDKSKGDYMLFVESLLKYEMDKHKDAIGCPLDKLILTSKGGKIHRTLCK